MVQRYLFNNSDELFKVDNARQELVTSLEKLVQNMLIRQLSSSGPTSIAYLFLKLSQTHRDLIVSSHHCKSWSRAYLSGNRHQAQVSADKCGVINETLAFLAVQAAWTNDQQHASILQNYASSIAQEPGGSDEWLYGRAGFLYLLRLVRHWSPSSRAAIDACITQVGHRIMEDGPPWEWHGKDYLGAVHGRIGIITQLVLCDPTYATHPKITSALENMLAMQDEESGNFPSSINSGKDHFVQFCHGAPGFALSLQSIQRYSDPSTQADIAHALAKARECIWHQGLLTKEPSLCHGITGNALALASPQREHFMAHTTARMIKKGKEEGWYIEGSDAHGLFCGEAGRAWGWAVLDAGKDMGIIGYSDL
ncbi:MAG: hypothetical protein Q9170_007281 [Blastenia crenularia]